MPQCYPTGAMEELEAHLHQYGKLLGLNDGPTYRLAPHFSHCNRPAEIRAKGTGMDEHCPHEMAYNVLLALLYHVSLPTSAGSHVPTWRLKVCRP